MLDGELQVLWLAVPCFIGQKSLFKKKLVELCYK